MRPKRLLPDYGAADRGASDQDAGFGLFQTPAFGLLAAMVVSAQRSKLALTYVAVELGE
jgi:hypothetical protein